jgi:hypothetical protein
MNAQEYKAIALSLLSGIGLGTFFYIVGGVAQPLFPAITPAVAATLGFVVGAGIAYTAAK